jgi:hypothetical protein
LVRILIEIANLLTGLHSFTGTTLEIGEFWVETGKKEADIFFG